MTSQQADPRSPATADTRTPFLVRLLDWLRKGYPAGVPRQDYVVLLGLLRRKLTEQEILQIAEDLAAQATADGEPISRDGIHKMINNSVVQPPSEDDIARVSARFAAGGWPLADPPTT